ncbi:MAG: hypothetical protein RLZZ378_599 [Actinomycetota bacterium]
MVATPHLGASTDEAQERAGIAVAQSVRKALSGELVPDAVNVKGGAIAEVIRPALPLVEKLAQVATALTGEIPVSIDVEVRGEIASEDVSVLATSALKGALIATGAEDVTYVNAPSLAADKNLTSKVSTDADSPDHRNLVSVRAACQNGATALVSGTLMGIKQIEKIVAIDDHDLDLKPTENLLFLSYSDRPGVVGVVGNALGKLKINIADMQVARDRAGGQALMALTVDSQIPADTVKIIEKETGASMVRYVNLVND